MTQAKTQKHLPSDSDKLVKEFLAWLAADQLPRIVRTQDQFPTLYRFCKANNVATVVSISQAIHNHLR